MSVSASSADITNIGSCTATTFSNGNGFSVASNGNLTCDRFVCEGKEIERIGTSFYGQDYIHHWGSSIPARWQVRGRQVSGSVDATLEYRFSTNSSGNAGAFLASNGNAWSTFSDLTIKHNIRPMENDCCSIIDDIDPVYFKYIGNEEDLYFNTERVGVLAQSCPAHTVEVDSDTGNLTVKYTELIPYLIKANQELHAALIVERERVDTLTASLNALTARVDALET